MHGSAAILGKKVGKRQAVQQWQMAGEVLCLLRLPSNSSATHLVPHAQLAAINSLLDFQHDAASSNGDSITITSANNDRDTPTSKPQSIQHQSEPHLMRSWSWLYSCHNKPRKRDTSRRAASACGCTEVCTPSPSLPAAAAGTSTALSQPLKAASCLSIHLQRETSPLRGRGWQ